MTGDLTTLANVKGYLPNLTGSTYDTLLGRLITAASAWIKSYLNRDVLQATYTEKLDGTGTSMLIVGQYPIVSVTSVVRDGLAVPASSVVGRQGYLALTDGSVFTAGFGNITVTYSAGYSAIPADIEQACIELVAWRFRERERVGLASKSLQTGGEVESYQTVDVPPQVKTLLKNWRRVV